MEFQDTLALDTKATRLKTGELRAVVRCARSGLQDYSGIEVGRPDLAKVTVYRPPNEVMKRDSARSFAGVPVTIDHPAVPVTTDNWKQFAVGETGEDVLRDGEFIRVPMLVRDEAAIQAIQSGKREISMGYSCTLDFEDGQTPDGQPFNAVQRDIIINHLAVVDRARGGSSLVVEDQRTDGRDGQTYRADANANNLQPARSDASNSHGGAPRQDGEAKMPHVLMIDGLQVPNVSDEAKAAIEKLQGQVKDAADAKAKVDTDLAKAVTDAATKDEKIAALTKQVEDAKVTPAQLRDAAKGYQAIVDKAKALGVAVTDAMGEAEIVKAVVTAKVGDASKDWSDDQFAASFASLTVGDSKPDPLRAAITAGAVQISDGASVRDTVRSMQYA